MKEEAILINLAGTPRSGIKLQTRKGTDIENEQAPGPSDDNLRVVARLEEAFRGRWLRRTAATGCYNCAGHVWASRRSSVYEKPDWLKILKDDGYRKISNADIEVGDLILHSCEGRFLHVGEIIEINCLNSAERTSIAKVPRVLSKFSSLRSGDESSA
jgi:hypothetical protein